MMRGHRHWRHRDWGVPPFGLRRRIFWSLVGAMLAAGVFTFAFSALRARLSTDAAGQAAWTGAGIWLCAAGSLWFASGRLAYRLVRPLNRLVDAVQRFGGGDFSARTGLSAGRRDEIGRVAQAIDEMAERIERQMNEERQLLAFVSHELRTPLARIRILTELARSGHGASLDDIDREVIEVDYLVSNILARSRLEFGTLSRKPVRIPDAAGEALDRAGLPPHLLTVSGDRAYEEVQADPTLLHRAIANLLDNAGRHGRGATAIEVRASETAIALEVLDSGPGFASAAVEDRFRSFSRETGEGRGQGLGIGLSLVKRIVTAHGGRVWAENREGGGARTGFELPLAARGM